MKKTKVKNSTFGKSLILTGLIFAIVAITMFLCPFIKTSAYDLDGFKVAFGHKEIFSSTIMGITTTTTLYEIKITALFLIGFILIALSALLGLFGFVGKGLVGKIVLAVAALLLIVAGVFMFVGKYNFASANGIDDANNVTTEIGAILCGSYSFAGALSFVGTALIK